MFFPMILLLVFVKQMAYTAIIFSKQCATVFTGLLGMLHFPQVSTSLPLLYSTLAGGLPCCRDTKGKYTTCHSKVPLETRCAIMPWVLGTIFLRQGLPLLYLPHIQGRKPRPGKQRCPRTPPPGWTPNVSLSHRCPPPSSFPALSLKINK